MNILGESVQQLDPRVDAEWIGQWLLLSTVYSGCRPENSVLHIARFSSLL
jgi:hypothetical protein